MERRSKRSSEKVGNKIRRLTLMNYVLIAVVVALFGFVIYLFIDMHSPANATTTAVNSNPLNFGNTIAGINQPLNASELAVINSGPDSYYEIAGGMLLNGTLANFVYNSRINSSYVTNGFVVNGKPSVIYVGALSCVYCGENRWAIALALSRFGSFKSLYYGYSAINDGDLPTLYWEPYNYTTAAGVAYGNSYSSDYINLISADYESPVTGGFEIQPLSYFVGSANNQTDMAAMQFMNDSGMYRGTPFMLWGNVLMPGADAVIVGNSLPTNNTLAMTYMTHQDVLRLLHDFNSQFSYSNYAAADVYAAMLCASMNNTAPFCSLPVMPKLEAMLGLE